jgi:hypothetical protein
MAGHYWLAYRIGLLDWEEVIAWADAMVAARDEPEPALLEVACGKFTGRADPDDHLWTLTDGELSHDVLCSVVGRLAVEFTDGRLSSVSITRILGNLFDAEYCPEGLHPQRFRRAAAWRERVWELFPDLYRRLEELEWIASGEPALRDLTETLEGYRRFAAVLFGADGSVD